MPRILITDEHGHQLPRLMLTEVPRPGDEISLVAPNGSRKWFDVARVVWSVPDPSYDPDAFAGTEGDVRTEDAIVIVRPKAEPRDAGPYRAPPSGA